MALRPTHLSAAFLLLLGAAATGCNSFPIRLYVDGAVLEELNRSRYSDSVRDTQIAGGVNVFLDYGGGPWDGEGAADRYFRVGGPEEGITPEEFEEVGTVWTTGMMEGDILLARNAKAQSLGATLTFDEFEYYNHIGVLVQHDGLWYVAESWPEIRLVGSANDFASRFEGQVERRPLGDFLERYETVQVVRIGTPEQRQLLTKVTRESLSEGLQFDPYHDPTEEAVSCSEYVELLFKRVELPRPERADVSRNKSLLRAKYALGYQRSSYVTPDAFARLPGAMHVGWISRFPNWQHLWIQEECVRILHERFRDDGQLGDFLEPAPLKLMRYKPTTMAFFRWAHGYFRSRPTRDVARVRRVLAQLYDICFETKGLRG